jgi:hypothetical protein
MKSMQCIEVIIVFLTVAACASIVDGSNQKLRVFSNPSAATCTLTRNGLELGTVTTPGGITVSRNGNPIDVTCVKQGYRDTSRRLASATNDAVAANMMVAPLALAGAAAGAIADSGSSSGLKYDDATTIDLAPDVAKP